VAFLNQLCPLLQEDLNSIVGLNSSGLNRQQTGMLDALRSPINTAGLTPIPLDMGDGRRKQVRISYFPATPAAQIVTTPADYCVTQTPQEPTTQIVTINRYRGTVGRALTAENVRLLCGPGTSAAELRQKMLLQDMRELNVSVNKDALTFASLNFGNHFQTGLNTPVSVNLFAGGAPDMFGFSSIMEGYYDIEGVNRPLIIGSGLVSRFFTSMNWGCCNDGGINLEAASGDAYFFRDKDANAIFGTNEFAVLSPGVMHFIQFRENAGEFMDAGDTYAHTRVMDPVTGMEYDVDLVYTPCNKMWSWRVGISYAFFVMPNQWPAAAAPSMSGVNGTLNFLATLTP